jgi:hypothetical protein
MARPDNLAEYAREAPVLRGSHREKQGFRSRRINRRNGGSLFGDGLIINKKGFFA